MKMHARVAMLTIWALLCCAHFNLAAQNALGNELPLDDPDYFKAVELTHGNVPTMDNSYTEIYRDTVEYRQDPQIVVKRDTIIDPMRVVTNHFGKNWFVFATGGVHTFRGDYSTIAGFGGTLSYDWSVGIGKWFTPGLAVKLEFIRGDSRGYTTFLTGHYGYGEMLLNKDNVAYRRLKTGWWDITGALVFNLSRLFNGYEGNNSPRMMNQFMFTLGFGGVHHLGFGHSHGSDNEWSGKVELQYSRFFSRSKRFSLDLKLRGIFYQTNFDLEYGYTDNVSLKWDTNVGIDVGFTWYLGKGRPNGWNRSTTQIYQRDYRQRDVLVMYENERNVVPVQKAMSFYVFYPNNYSGRNDSPVVEGQEVNAIDYLAGGIYTQKRYADTDRARACAYDANALANLAVTDIPTERVDKDLEIDFIPRGYEMDIRPLSLSRNGGDMLAFADSTGFIYAPIYDLPRVWEYRIDRETSDQRLLSGSNYAETTSFGLNSHQGLQTVRENLNVDPNEDLVSFADVYAAMYSNEGYISQFTDAETVERIRDIFDNGNITYVTCYGCATSQDNYSGQNAVNVGLDRNSTLAECRAETVKKWLQSNPRLDEARPLTSIMDLSNIHRVSSPSTRGIEAKKNRCVKVTIIYMDFKDLDN